MTQRSALICHFGIFGFMLSITLFLTAMQAPAVTIFGAVGLYLMFVIGFLSLLEYMPPKISEGAVAKRLVELEGKFDTLLETGNVNSQALNFIVSFIQEVKARTPQTP